MQTLQTATLHRVLHGLTGFRGLEGVDRIDVLEHEGQVEQAIGLGDRLEERQRRGRKLDVTAQHRLDHLLIGVERRVREDLHAGGPVHLFVDALHQERRGDPFGMPVGVRHVAELDDHFAVVAGGERGAGHQGDRGNAGHLHE